MSTATPLAPIQGGERVEAIDIIRGIALLGVLTVNLLTEFRVSLFQWLEEFHTHPGQLNHAIDWIVALVVESKSFAMFSFLFGVGLAVQAERVERRGATSVRAFMARRFAALLLIGLCHLILIWNGDILTMYAVCGLLMLPFARSSPGVLLGVAVILGALASLPLPIPDFLPHGADAHRWATRAEAVYGRGSYGEILAFRLEETRRYILPLLASSMPRTLGLFALGMGAWKRGILRSPSDHLRLLGATAVIGIVIGAGAEALAAWAAASQRSLGAAASLVSTSGTVGLGLGYMAALLLILRSPTWRRVLGPASYLGRMALTNYLSQSVILGVIFYGYGLGLFGQLGPATALLLGLALYVAQIFASAMWLKRFRFGPVEWAWRTFTYGALQPMRLGAGR